MNPGPSAIADGSDKKRRSQLRDRLSFCVFRAHDRKRSVALLQRASRGDLSLCHVFGLWSFRALRHFKLDFLTLFESLETIALNGAIVNEDVRRAWLFNKAIALRVVKPLDLTGYSRHTNESS